MTYRLPPKDVDSAPKPKKVNAPFSETQIGALVKWQQCGSSEKVLCPKHEPQGTPMVVTANGYRCTVPECDVVQPWAYEFIFKTKYCTKEAPYKDEDLKDLIFHVDAEEIDPEYDGEIISFHCPHCKRFFTVDLR